MHSCMMTLTTYNLMYGHVRQASKQKIAHQRTLASMDMFLQTYMYKL
jgi:hypothetical protein